MANNPLNIISADNSPGRNSPSPSYPGGKSRRLEAQAYFDRLWLLDSESMNPMRNSMERERLKRTMELVKAVTTIKEKRIVDLGCGSGVFSKSLSDEGGLIDAVDIAGNALKKVKKMESANITPLQDYVPMTKLQDNAYDLVVCMELIADLPSNEYRLLFSELARLVKSDGKVVCSTSIDIHSEDALQKFANLAETEIQIDKWVFSYHLLYIKIKDFFEAPSRFVKGNKDQEYRARQLNTRKHLAHWWFRLNSSTLPACLWYAVSFLSDPLANLIKQNRGLLLRLEKICRLIWSDSGISHAMFIGKRRPLAIHPPANEIPRETKHKKQVWE